VISRSDVPPEWSSKKATSTDRGLRGVRDCKQINKAVDDANRKVPRARSREFRDPNSLGSTSAESAVYAFRDTEAAQRFLAVYNDPDAVTCYRKGAARTAAGQPTAGPPEVTPITDLQGVGDEAVGFETKLSFSRSGLTFTLYLDIIRARVGRAVQGFKFSNLDARFATGPEIVRAVVARVAATEAAT
jgi:hypothetical protein